MSFLKTAAKAIAVGLIAATGVGLFYLLSKTRIINEGFRGISYNSGKLVVLDPGIHILLSPTHVFDKEIPINKDQVVRLNEFEIKTSDSVPAMIQADFTYRIDNAKDAVLQVEDYHEAVKETVKGAISSILQQHRYDQLTSVQISSRPSNLPSNQNGSSINLIAEECKADQQNNTPSIFERIKAALNETCKNWGISISRMRLISVDAKDKRISNEIAETSLSHLRASNQLVAAQAKADALNIEAEAQKKAKKTLAEGDADALTAMAKAKIAAVKLAASELRAPAQREMYRLQLGLDAARALGATTGTIALGNSPFPLFTQSKSERLAREEQQRQNQEQGPDIRRSLSMNNLASGQ